MMKVWKGNDLLSVLFIPFEIAVEEVEMTGLSTVPYDVSPPS